MAYQVKTTKNYGNRLLDSLKGAGFGFILFFVGTIILCVNEGNYVKNDKAIGEAARTLVRVNDVSTVDAALNGKLIHANAFADTQDVLADDLFGVREKAVALTRAVEYYQYQEKAPTTTKKDKLGGGEETTTTYTYEKKWVSSPINSGGFSDPDYQKSNFVLENEVKSQIQYAENVTFGAYKLPSFIVKSIRGNVPAELRIINNELQQWNDRVTKRVTELGLKANSNAALAHVQGNVLYLGNSPSSPQIGDVRITLAKTAPADISIIAKVAGSTFEQYTAKNGREFWSVEMGTVSADTMISNAKKTNSAITWLLRLIGIILVVGSLKMVFKILPTLFKVLPPLATIVGAGVGLVCWVGGVAWSLVIISLAWLFYRPMISIPMLVIAVAGIWFLRKKAKERKTTEVTASAAAEPEAVTAPEAVITNAAPSADGWTCECGTVNKGKFCANCGKPKPAGVPQYKCDKCGWEPKDMKNVPKFCPNCGDPFDDGDIVK
jgi:hypothetical protein